jgi:hypothetical protein
MHKGKATTTAGTTAFSRKNAQEAQEYDNYRFLLALLEPLRG